MNTLSKRVLFRGGCWAGLCVSPMPEIRGRIQELAHLSFDEGRALLTHSLQKVAPTMHLQRLGMFTGCLIAVLLSSTGNCQDNSLFFQNVRIFDGESFQGPTNVLVQAGVIKAVSPDLTPLAGSKIIDGDGKTLLPGLIDCHVHAFSPAHLEQAAIFGVTTELDMMSIPVMANLMRRESATVAAQDRADFLSAGAAVTVQGGHGTQFGFKVPVLESADKAAEFVAARVAEGSDYIKVILDDGQAIGIAFPTLSDEMLTASVRAAKVSDKLAVAHVSSQVAAKKAIEAGIDGLVHLFADQPVDPALATAMVKQHTFVIPTATIVVGVCGRSLVDNHLEDEHLRAYLTNADVVNIRRTYPARSAMPSKWATLIHNIEQLHAAGVPILAGTDAPNPGTVHGASLHVELELLVEAGLTTQQALSAATSVAARHFGLDDRGTIQPGRRADLLLVQGDPQSDIRATRNIVGVWRAGYEINRSDRRKQVVDEQREASQPAAKAGERITISDFEAGKLSSSIGSGWSESTDKLFGGSSTVSLTVHDGGASDTKKSLLVRGTVRTEQPAFAGAMLSPGDAPMAPADLSRFRTLSFWTRGDGQTYNIMIFTQKGGMLPATKTFVAQEEWQQQSYRFEDFAGCDGKDVIGIFVGSGQAGEFELQLDELQAQ